MVDQTEKPRKPGIVAEKDLERFQTVKEGKTFEYWTETAICAYIKLGSNRAINLCTMEHEDFSGAEMVHLCRSVAYQSLL